MQAWERAILALYSLLMAALSLALAVISAGWTIPLDLYEYTLTRIDYRLAGVTVATALFLLSLRFLWASIRLPSKMLEQAVVYQGEAGEATIALTALEHLVIRASRQVKGIREVKPRIKILPDGVAVFLEISVTPEQNLPALAQNLQEMVRSYITATTGLESVEVRILINGILQESVRRLE